MSALLSPEDQSRIAVIRAKAADGTATTEDYKEFIRTLRQGRTAALTATAASRAKAKAAIPSADDLLGELEGL